MKLQQSFFLFVWSCSSASALKPKMLGEAVDGSGRRLKDKISDRPGSSLTSKSAIFVGECSPGTSFQFKVGGGAGRGAIGLVTGEGKPPTLAAADGCDDCRIDVNGEAEANFFALEVPDGTVGYPLLYQDIPSQGATVNLECDVASDVIVVIEDTNSEQSEEIEAEVTWAPGKKKTVEQTIKLKKGKADKTIRVKALKNKIKNGGKANPKKDSDHVSVTQAGKSGVTIEHDLDGEVVLVAFEITDSTGNLVPRTLVMETSDLPPPQVEFSIEGMNVNSDADLELAIGGQPAGVSYLYQIRIGIMGVLPGGDPNQEQLVDVVDYSAIIDGNQVPIVVNGGWIRNAIDELGLEGMDNFEIVVSEGHSVDPENGYQLVGELSGMALGGSVGQLSQGDRRRLSARPTNEEKGEISMDMMQGRKPDEIGEMPGGLRQRRLNSNNLILVHGYCGSNSFPTSQFTSEEVFNVVGSGGTGSNNWSHHTFATKIDQFADAESMTSCGIVAHSQGGAAALHLYAYIWSCLDNATGASNRRIQSVGTPYLGSSLSGNLAALGSIFGAGCGANNDLTHSGAASWLSNIPSWARAKVTYHTTSFTDKWWRYDYCHLASDLLLGDPDDGAVAKARGQLSGANNGGHKTGWCHTGTMRDPNQCTDSGRNSYMDSQAAR